MTPDEATLQRLSLELAEARQKFPNMASLHEGYAVILEEVDEYWEECKKKPAVRAETRLQQELLQIAAMAIRTLTDLVPYDEEALQCPHISPCSRERCCLTDNHDTAHKSVANTMWITA